MECAVLNVCGIVRPTMIVVASVAMLSILAPGLFATIWPYLAAAGVLIVPVMVYRWWDTRYNPGCSVRYTTPPEPDKAENA